MSANASNYVYQVKISKDAKKPEPTVSVETIAAYRRNVEKYLVKKDDTRAYQTIQK